MKPWPRSKRSKVARPDAWLFGLSLGLMVVTGPVHAAPVAGYLPALGPSRLRFLPARSSLPRLVLPPLDTGEPAVPVTAALATPSVTADPGSEATVGSGEGTPAMAVAESVVNGNARVADDALPRAAGGEAVAQAGGSAGSEVLSPPTIVTPQMLLQFFRPTGSNWVGLTAPVFVPPSAPVSSGRPSSAVYRSP